MVLLSTRVPGQCIQDCARAGLRQGKRTGHRWLMINIVQLFQNGDSRVEVLGAGAQIHSVVVRLTRAAPVCQIKAAGRASRRVSRLPADQDRPGG